MNSTRGPWSLRTIGTDLDWMLVPSLALGLVAMLAYIGWFTLLATSGSPAAPGGWIGLAAAACLSLLVGAMATRLLHRLDRGRRHGVISWLIVLTISGNVFLLLLAAYALCRA